MSLLLFAAAAGLLYVNNLLNLVNRGEILGNAGLTESEIYADDPIHNVSDSTADIEDAKEDFESAQKAEVLNDKGIENIAVLAAKPNNGHWKNNEYLQQYPWIEYNEQQKLFLVYMPNGSTVLLSDWLIKNTL